MNICAFCGRITNYEHCSSCEDYKGIMPINRETLIYLGEDLDEWADYLD